MKIIEMAATRWHVLKLKCTKFDFGWGSAQTPLGSLQRSPDPLAGFKGPTSNGREEKKDGREGQGRGGDIPLRRYIAPITVLRSLLGTIDID